MNTPESFPAAAGRPQTGPQLGGRRLMSPFVQAALSGYSDRPMRKLAQRYGASYTLAEVMIDRFAQEARGTGRTAHHFDVRDDDHPVGGQLMGADPESFVPAARRLVAAGFDVIDINFGCPVKSALGGCRGGYLLGQPETALEIVRRVRDTVPAPIPVTLKMRRGIDDSVESRDKFFQILDGAFAAGVAGITVHARTVEQKYRGPSRWGFLREVKQHVGDRTILGSGDLFTAEDCLAMLQFTGVDGVTIARGAIGNPWIFRQADALWRTGSVPCPPSIHEQRTAISQHRDLAEECHGPDRWLTGMRKFGFKYARLHPRFAEVRDAFGQVRTGRDWDALVERFYGDDGPGRFPQLDDVHPAESEDVAPL